MKIAILGYSSTGKSTMAQRCALKWGVPALHIDTIQFLPGWEIRPLEEKRRLMREFLDGNDGWVIEGNYGDLYQERRLQEADKIILLEFNRFASLLRAWKRYVKYRGKERASMTKGCPERFDKHFAYCILIQERKGHKHRRYREIEAMYPDKVTVIRNQRQMNTFMRREGIPAIKTEG